jgi:trans-aconitate 2-methyltransferase
MFMLKFRKILSIFLLGSICLWLTNIDAKSVDHWNGEEYTANSDLQFKWASEKLKKLKLNGDEKILDIGCGDGRFTEALAHHVPKGKVVGIDSSDSMLSLANNILKSTQIDNLSFLKQDAVSLDFYNQFDLAVSFTVFHWLPDHLAALKGIERALKPGGRVFIYFAPDHGKDRFDHAIDYVIAQPQWQVYLKDFNSGFYLSSPIQFANYIHEANLLFKRLEIITVDEVFKNKESFMQWMTGWMPHLKYLPKEKHKSFMAAIINKYLEKHPLDNQGKLHFYDYFMEVEAEKPSDSKLITL